MLHELTVVEAVRVNAGERRRLARQRVPEHAAQIRAARRPAGHDRLALGSLVFEDEQQVGEGAAQGAGAPLEALGAVLAVVVVHEVGGGEGADNAHVPVSPGLLVEPARQREVLRLHQRPLPAARPYQHEA
ncbi:MAG TPA: hypothetical protein VKA51_06635 [Rubrobacteraceae bacterium]|nr:hypothetical protein [Rubrobacteraceae bacterium]